MFLGGFAWGLGDFCGFLMALKFKYGAKLLEESMEFWYTKNTTLHPLSNIFFSVRGVRPKIERGLKLISVRGVKETIKNGKNHVFASKSPKTSKNPSKFLKTQTC
jgi:hypothetical protein